MNNQANVLLLLVFSLILVTGQVTFSKQNWTPNGKRAVESPRSIGRANLPGHGVNKGSDIWLVGQKLKRLLLQAGMVTSSSIGDNGPGSNESGRGELPAIN